MRSIFDPADAAALRARLRTLAPTAPARWGRFNAPRMVAHLGDQLGLALGDATAALHWTPLHWMPLRVLVVHLLPWPKGRLPTVPETLVTAPGEWADDVARVDALLERASARGRAGPWPPHPAFGAMPGWEWGSLVHKHTDHHLRQFGA